MNPFKVGDKVKVIPESMEELSEYFKEYNHHSFAVVNWVDDTLVGTNLDRDGSHYTHYELYKEEETTMNSQQKTKRVPFTHELWEKYMDIAKIIYIPSGGEVLGFAYFPQADSLFRYAYLTRTGTAPTFGSGESFWLEIPVTTKRIPFNPELKDAKAVCKHTSDELLEWAYMNTSGVICGVIKHECGGYVTGTYHPNTLEMEIEEDV